MLTVVHHSNAGPNNRRTNTVSLGDTLNEITAGAVRHTGHHSDGM